MWIYNQATGELWRDLQHIATGYSGHAEGKNNPLYEDHIALGPIPRGYWTIGKPVEGTHMGPHALPLTPFESTQTFARSGFAIHGDEKEHAGQASKGCIVLDPFTRGRLAESNDRVLQVI